MQLGNILQVARSNPNGAAWLRVIRQGETSQDPRAYYMVNGGAYIDDLARHPWDGIPTTQGAKATGAYQFLGTTWAECREMLDLPDFSPESQDLAALFLTYRRGALDDVLAGRIPEAMAKCANEWVSLPPKDWAAVYAKYGGLLNDSQPAAPIEERSETLPPQTKDKPMGALTVLLPLITQLLPMVGTLFGGHKDAQNAQAIGTVLDTIVKATGQAGPADVGTVGTAIQMMQADKAVTAKVAQAIVTNPEVLPLLQIGEVAGGAAAARQSDLQSRQAPDPFYKTSAVFWISIILIPLVAWYVGSSIVGGIEIPKDWPWYAQLPLKIFGVAWDAGARVGLANLVVGLVLGGICGVYFGVSVTQQKQAAQAPVANSTPQP